MEIFSLEEAAWKMRNGSVVAYPTETVYGLGTVIYDEDALQRIKQIKGSGANKPLSVLISGDDLSMLDELVDDVLPIAQRLIKFFWPGPLTIIHKCKDDIPASVTGNTGFIGIRCSSHPMLNSLVKEVGHPIISTSANPSGMSPATSYEQIFHYFKTSIDGILLFDADSYSDKKNISYNQPSTIIRVEKHNFQIIREGSISKNDILRKIYD